MFRNYIKIAWRNIAKNKLYSIINILGLSLGIAVCLLITLFVKDEFSFDQYQKQKNEIYRLVIDERSSNSESFKYGDTGLHAGNVFSKQLPEITRMVRIKSEFFNIKHPNGTEVMAQEASHVDSSFFNIFNADFIAGSPFKALSQPNFIVISEKVAKLFFGNDNAINKTLAIEVDGAFKNFLVKGVSRNSPQNSTVQIELLMPFDYTKNTDNFWMNSYLNTFFNIKNSTNLAQLELKMNQIYAREAKDELAKAKKEWKYDSKTTYKLQPFLQMHLSRDYRAQNGLKSSSNTTLSLVLGGMALFILLIACINFVNITTSHAIQRSKEIGIRKVIGGERKQLIYQFLGESFILNLIAFLLALLWVQLALPSFNDLSSKALAFEYLFDIKLISYFIGIFLLTGFLAGFYPAIILSGLQPADTLYGRFKLSGKNYLQKSLLVLQFGLAIFFIILTIVQMRQVNLFTSKDLGYNDDNLVVLTTGRTDRTKGETFIQELKNSPMVQSVSPRNQGTWYTMTTINGNQNISPDMNVVDEGFLPTLGLKILEGRNFSKDFPGDSTLSVLVNEAFVKEAKWKNAIGQNVLVMNRENYKVVGVVKDYHFASLYEKVRPQLFLNNMSHGSYQTFLIKINSQNLPAALEFIKTKFKMMFPTKPFSYEFQTAINEKQYEKEQQMKLIILWVAGIIIFVSCMGLFGLSVLTTEKRRKEIGIRKVLGASLGNIVQKLSTEYLKLILISFVIFAPLAYILAIKLLENYPYRITIGADIFVVCFIGILLITFITVSYQSLRAALENPVKSLKTE